MRRWQAHQAFALAGQRFRVRAGYKSPEDLCLEWDIDGKWVAIPMSVGLMLNDFFYENEDVLYPKERGFKGGDYWRTYARHAERHGWQKAWAGVEAAKSVKSERPTLFGEAS